MEDISNLVSESPFAETWSSQLSGATMGVTVVDYVTELTTMQMLVVNCVSYNKKNKPWNDDLLFPASRCSNLHIC